MLPPAQCSPAFKRMCCGCTIGLASCVKLAGSQGVWVRSALPVAVMARLACHATGQKIDLVTPSGTSNQAGCHGLVVDLNRRTGCDSIPSYVFL